MIQGVEISFQTENESEIPRVGHRKTLWINGGSVTLYARIVHVTADKTYIGEPMQFTGTVTYTDRWW